MNFNDPRIKKALELSKKHMTSKSKRQKSLDKLLERGALSAREHAAGSKHLRKNPSDCLSMLRSRFPAPSIALFDEAYRDMSAVQVSHACILLVSMMIPAVISYRRREIRMSGSLDYPSVAEGIEYFAGKKSVRSRHDLLRAYTHLDLMDRAIPDPYPPDYGDYAVEAICSAMHGVIYLLGEDLRPLERMRKPGSHCGRGVIPLRSVIGDLANMLEPEDVLGLSVLAMRMALGAL